MNFRSAYIVLLLIAGAATAAPPNDASISQRLVGKWNGVERRANVEVIGTTDVQRNGTVKVRSLVEMSNAEPFEVNVEGTWIVRSGFLIQTITKSTHPELVAPGEEIKDKVLSVSNKRVELESEAGRQLSWQRR